MAEKNPTILISSDMNELNKVIKRQRLFDWMSKHDIILCCMQETLYIKDSNTFM